MPYVEKYTPFTDYFQLLDGIKTRRTHESFSFLIFKNQLFKNSKPVPKTLPDSC